jgi:hypothetical protein
MLPLLGAWRVVEVGGALTQIIDDRHILKENEILVYEKNTRSDIRTYGKSEVVPGHTMKVWEAD